MPSIVPQGLLASNDLSTDATTRTVVSVATSRAVPAGRSVLVCVGTTGAGGVDHTFSATDSKGNTYTFVKSKCSANTRQAALLVGNIATALASGDSITVTDATGGRNRWLIQVFEFTGMKASPVDASAPPVAATAPNNAAMTVGPTSTPGQADILAVGVWDHGPSNTFTAPSGWSAAGTITTAAGTNEQRLSVAYLATAPGSPAAITAAATQSAGSEWAGLVAIFDAAVTQVVQAAGVTYSGTAWTRVGGTTDQGVLGDSSAATYLQTPDNPTTSNKAIVAMATPSPLPGAGDSYTFNVDVECAGATTAQFTATVKRGGTTTVETFSNVSFNPAGELKSLTLAPASVTAITSASQWNAVTVEVAITGTP